jgi:AAA family ATP:ADP antiporter
MNRIRRFLGEIRDWAEPIRGEDWLRIASLAALIFLILGSYAIARPATESLFLGENGSQSLPMAWLAVALGSLIVVTLYNRWSATTDLVVLFGGVSGISAGLLVVLLGATHAGVPGMSWALYLWKDLYIVVLIEIFWSFANTVVPVKQAKWLYGLFCVVGSLGGMAGNLGVGVLARTFGTQNTLWAVVPLLLFSWAACLVLVRIGSPAASRGPVMKVKPSYVQGFHLLRKSRALWLLMLLIGTVQVVITLIDYQINIAIESNYTNTDARTAVIGQIYAAIDVVSLVLQLATGPILRLLGVPLVLLLIPGLLGAAVVGYALVPRFAAIAAAKVASKAFDYSLFRAAKEILYIPMTREEKTRGKAFVDMMTYRCAKGATSLMLLGLMALGAPGFTLGLTLVGILIWIGVTFRLNRRLTLKKETT